MAKSDDNYLRGWCRQVRHALDEGTELGYEAAELIDELLGLIEPDGDSGGEVELPDTGSLPSPQTLAGGPPDGPQQMYLPGIPGVGSPVGAVAPPLTGGGATVRVDDATAGVPRGTRGGLPLCRRRGR